MITEINTHSSASALAKLFGIDYKVAGEFKEFLENSDLITVPKTYIIKDKPVKYEAYNIIEAIEYTYQHFAKLSGETVHESKPKEIEIPTIDNEKLDLFLKIDIE